MDRDVFLSLLALDSYNRGYGENIGRLRVDPNVTKIGDATIVTDSRLTLGAEAQAAGFYAIAYDWDGETVISYRGTNFDTASPSGFFNSPAFKDIFAGWSVGAGFSAAAQAGLARDFYFSVLQNQFGLQTDAFTVNDAPITLTGHSLGGGLAGFISSLSGKSSLLFDHMPFGVAAEAQAASEAVKLTFREFGLDGRPLIDTLTMIQNGTLPEIQAGTFTRSQFEQGLAANRGLLFDPARPTAYHVDGEALEYVRTGAVQAGLGALLSVIGSLSSLPILNFAGLSFNDLGSKTAALEGLVFNQEISKRNAKLGPIQAHSMALQSLLLFGEKQWGGEGGSNKWKEIIRYVLPALFDDDLAEQAFGLKRGETGSTNPSAQLFGQIAYSALKAPNGTTSGDFALVFGDTGIRALFDDADQLGTFVERYQKGIPQDALYAIGEKVAEFAGLLATNKIEAAEYSLASEGAIDPIAAEHTVGIDLSDATWSQYSEAGDYVPLDREKFFDRLIEPALAKLNLDQTQRSKILNMWKYWQSDLQYASYTIGASEPSHYWKDQNNEPLGGSQLVIIDDGLGKISNSALGLVNFYHDGPGVFVISGNGANNLTGTDSDDIFVTGSGSDVLIGGGGWDLFFAGGGSNSIWGGLTTDAAESEDGDTVYYNQLSGATRVLIDGSDITINHSAGVDDLHNIEQISVNSAFPLLVRFGAEITAGIDLTITSEQSRGQIINGKASLNGIETLQRSNGEIYGVRDRDTRSTVYLEGFQTELVGSEYDDRLVDGSESEKVVNAGAGNDFVNVGFYSTFFDGNVEVEGDTVIFGGEGSDTLISGSGRDLIIDQQSAFEDTFDLAYFESEYLNLYNLAGVVRAGAGDDTIVVSLPRVDSDSNFFGYSPEQMAFQYFAPFPSYHLDPGAGDDKVTLDTNGLKVSYRFRRGDGVDIVETSGSVDLNYSSRIDVSPGSIDQPIFEILAEEYEGNEITVSFNKQSQELIWADLPNRDGPPIWVARGSVTIAFSPSDSITLTDVHAFAYGPRTPDYDSPPMDSDYIIPLQVRTGSGTYIISDVGQPTLAESAFSKPMNLRSAALVAPVDTGIGVEAAAEIRVEGGGSKLLSRGSQNAFGGDDWDELLISWSMNALTVTGSGDSISIRVKWGADEAKTFTGFDSFYIAEVDQSFSPADFLAHYGSSSNNNAPIIAQVLGDLLATEDEPFTFSLNPSVFTDVDADDLSLVLTLADGSPLPDWLSFDGSTLAGIAPQDYNGDIVLRYSAFDSEFAASQTFKLKVASVNDAPILADPLADIDVSPSDVVSISNLASRFTDVDGDALAITAKVADGGDLPAWLSFDGANLGGIVPADFAGDLAITITASDGSLTAQSSFLLAGAEVSNRAPVLVAPYADLIATEDTEFSFTLDPGNFNDPDGDAVTLSMRLSDGGALPSWLTFADNHLAGQPPLDSSGEWSLLLGASDGTNTTENEVRLVVTPVNDGPRDVALASNSIAENSPQGTVVGSFYVDDPDIGDSHSFAIVAGSVRLDEALLFDPNAPLTTPFTGTDSGKNGTGLRLTSMGRYLGANGQGAFTVWRIRNGGTLERSVRLNASSGSLNKTLTVAPGTDTYILSRDVAGSATHRLYLGSTLLDTKASSSTAFSSAAEVSLANPMFVIAGGNLVVAPSAQLDFERISNVPVTVKATDAAGESVVRTFRIGIADVDESGNAASRTTMELQPEAMYLASMASFGDSLGDPSGFSIAEMKDRYGFIAPSRSERGFADFAVSPRQSKMRSPGANMPNALVGEANVGAVVATSAAPIGTDHGLAERTDWSSRSQVVDLLHRTIEDPIAPSNLVGEGGAMRTSQALPTIRTDIHATGGAKENMSAPIDLTARLALMRQDMAAFAVGNADGLSLEKRAVGMLQDWFA